MHLQEKKHNIGIFNEKSLHVNIKNWYSRPGDRLEVPLDNFFIDIVRDDLLIEIQIQNFSSIRKKLNKLLKNYKVRLIFPVPQEKWIVKLSKEGDLLHRRKSPKKGKLQDVFSELVYIPQMINHPNFELEVLMIKVDEIRCDDGSGSWRRKGVSIKDRKLLNVTKSQLFTHKKDFLSVIPSNLIQPFSNKSFASRAKISIYLTRKITYTLNKMGAIHQVGKRGNEKLFVIRN